MEEPTFVLVCEDCGHFVEDPKTGEEHLEGHKENECIHLSNAEILKQIHEVKRPTHRPYIRTEYAGEVHIPDSAFRAAQFREGAVVEGAPDPEGEGA